MGGSKNLKLSPNTCLGAIFQKLYCRDFCYFCLSVIKMTWAIAKETKQRVRRPVISTIVNSHKLNFQKQQTFAEIFDWWKIENISYFYFWNKTCQKGQNFQFFKEPFLHNGWPYGYNFWLVFRDLCEASKKYNLRNFYQHIAKVITCQKLLKTRLPLTKRRANTVGAAKLYVPNTTL